MSYKIIDNFLPENIFNPLFDLMSSYHFPWYFNEFVADEDSPLDNFQFTHTFFNTSIDVVHTPYHNFISPIIDRLDVKKLERVKANLNPRTSTHEEGGYHIDMEDCTTSILYLNTNNGWTEIQGNGKIECVKNRLVTFDSNLIHSGYTCTDQKRKVVLNFNYVI